MKPSLHLVIMLFRYKVPVITLACAVFLTLTPTNFTASASNTEAGEVIRVLGEEAVRVLRDKDNTTFEQREEAFRNILVEGFHIKTISRFVLGRYWKKATEAQRKAYNDLFVDFIVRVYASRFDSYNGETFLLEGVIDSDIEGDSVVRTRIIRPTGGSSVGVDFRVRVIDGVYKVVDINVEGISMLHTHRVEFSSVINRKGIDGFLDELRSQLEIRDQSEIEK